MSELPEILFLGIALYVLYRFIFNFVVPIARTTRHVRQQFRNAQEAMRNQQQQSGGGYNERYNGAGGNRENNNGPESKKTATPPNDLGEYIDFEEVK